MARTAPGALPGARTLIVALGALTAFGPLSLDMYLPGLPQLARDLGSSTSLAQLTLTACMVGLAGGQLLAGPLSDARGRRGPLLVGLALYALASALCALAPSIWVLILLRLVQGAAGAAGIVIARAVVRDLHEGEAAARFYALLMLVNGVAPIAAPIVGGQLLGVTDWRGVFWALTAIGLVLLLVGWRCVPETLPAAGRHGGGLRATTSVFGALLRDRGYLGCALAQGLCSGMMFCYIAGSPFVIQQIYGRSEQLFSVVFAVNALGIVLLAQLSARLVGRLGPRRLLVSGLWLGLGGALALLLAVVADAGLLAVLASFFAIVSSVGLVTPNATALALAGEPSTAGSASALLGLAQFAFGAAFAPLVGIGGEGTALPLALTIAALGAASVSAYALLGRSGRSAGDEHIPSSTA
ncbi:multidrug effflux MFS transporter [Conexibacter sp. JD483]|uniref:multidrug effflux MFS transporter n=1 Tax=unclassified Conexibacter TaxID=2627773 RepID=UPI002723FDB0|nr:MULTISPECIES: multidrug effflux MFS transporter [unclassified Conexibacter]MDO8188890.1 multidrug effflux MFS transporter [Conexibacter sp. CPCC 205706]MDO8201680.1 multidrug effflux MFS transporter [Conexibacter sp. CPCC 205762]MDR9372142.1 multidrug effflux MFS transporter [Conexibacter sp. JD483]